MFLNKFKSTYLLLVLLMLSCAKQIKKNEKTTVIHKTEAIILKTGAAQTNLYIPKLTNKNIAVVANQTSVLNSQASKIKNQNITKFVHLVDTLLSSGISVKKVFAPEHGFRGKADAGEHVKDGFDAKTKLPLISLHGKTKKLPLSELTGIDVVVFDIQDVGARFYTYISTLHYVMEACAKAKVPVIVLDRPNPNGHYIDGPLLELKHKSFVGMHKVPVVYGMTIGEYAQMINGEQWLQGGIQCDLTVIPLVGYTHNTEYSLPIKPSPNLPNDKAINLYPSLCFFEGTTISCGRGTNTQFQIYGSPYLEKTGFSFTPQPNEGAKYPKHQNKLCYGENLQNITRLSQINLSWLINVHQQTSTVKTKFWNNFFTKLAGTEKLQQQIMQGLSEEEIRKSWKKDLEDFKKIRKKYLMYK